MDLVIALLVILAIGGLLALAAQQKREAEQAMAAFALQQGWTPLATDDSLLNYLPQYLLKAALNVRSGGDVQVAFDMAYQATIKQIPLVFFQYECTVTYEEVNSNGMVERQSTTMIYNVINAQLTKAQPNVMLLHHSFMSKLSGAGQHPGMQQLRLEGDFNKDYDTYILPHSEVDVLTLLTPDVMAMLADIKDASAQFSGQSVILSLVASKLTPAIIIPLLNSVADIARKVDHLPDASA